MAEQVKTTISSAFANADTIVEKVEEMSKDTVIAVPAVVMVSDSPGPSIFIDLLCTRWVLHTLSW